MGMHAASALLALLDDGVSTRTGEPAGQLIPAWHHRPSLRSHPGAPPGDPVASLADSAERLSEGA